MPDDLRAGINVLESERGVLLGRERELAEEDVDQVVPGTAVTVGYPDGTRQTVWIGPAALGGELDIVATTGSPLGRALLGHRPGDTVVFTAPAGPQRVQVLSVRPVTA